MGRKKKLVNNTTIPQYAIERFARCVFDDIRADLGGNVYGDRVQEYQFSKIARGFTKGRNDTVYTAEDMVIKPIEEKLPEGTDDLFDTDDDEI